MDRQDRQPGENVIAGSRPRRAHDRDPLGKEAAGDEPQDLRRGAVEPLRVIDETGQRLLLGDLGEQRERGQPHQEPVGRRAGATAEHRRERVALRSGQPVQMAQHRRAELVQAGVGQLHLRLDAGGPRDMPADHPVGQVPQQRALTHARLAPQDDDPAPARERVGHEPVERLTLAAASEELRGWRGSCRVGGLPAPFNDRRRYEQSVHPRPGLRNPADPGAAPGCLPGATHPSKHKGDSRHTNSATRTGPAGTQRT